MQETIGDNWALLLDISPNFDEKVMPWQKRDCMPATVNLCRKGWKNSSFFGCFGLIFFIGTDLLHQRLTHRILTHGEDVYNFWSKTFLLPEEFEKFKEYFSKLEKPEPFILKAASSACGRNIKLVTSIDQVDPKDLFIVQKKPLAQKYLSDVLLLDGYKFTFRIYVALVEVDPYRIYIYPEGITRIASKK